MAVPVSRNIYETTIDAIIVYWKNVDSNRSWLRLEILSFSML